MAKLLPGAWTTAEKALNGFQYWIPPDEEIRHGRYVTAIGFSREVPGELQKKLLPSEYVMAIGVDSRLRLVLKTTKVLKIGESWPPPESPSK